MAGLLSAGELDAMRATIGETLPDSCVVLRRTDVSDGAGGWTPVWATAATLPCRVRPTGQITPSEQPAADRLQGRMPFTVTLPVFDAGGVATDVHDTDQIRRTGDTTALEVIGVALPESWPLSVRVLTALMAPD